uniref:Uncharacterized protein n=1 Tax=Physcomitrium patens TaxID=3218 RepID=A0A2K1IZ96_PHYPA|nr:hypothetical protein PHYPA_024420 [Physcomitrium patens]
MINEYVRLREIGTGSYGNGVLAIAIIFRLSANLSNAFKTEVVKTTNFMLHGVDLYA